MNKNDYLSNFSLNSKSYYFYDIKKLFNNKDELLRLPYSIRILLEGSLRKYDNYKVTTEHIDQLINWGKSKSKLVAEVPFIPSRIILQDFTGVPAVVDLAAMRSEAYRAGKDPEIINPQVPVDLIIDHSVMVDSYGTNESLSNNIEMEFTRNQERYRFLKWAMNSFENFRVFPPAEGIIHQINLEKLATLAIEKEFKNSILFYPDTLVGTDSHTTMINGLGVVGYGVGGIEAEAAMLGQPVYMPLPQVVGVKLLGKTSAIVSSTDIALHITNTLRKHNVVGKFIEYFGEGTYNMSLTNRATIANMAPEYGATMGYFPVDKESLNYMLLTARDKELVEKVEAYYKNNMLFRYENDVEPEYSQVIEIDLEKIKPAIAGPKRPQDLLYLNEVKDDFIKNFNTREEKIKKISDNKEDIINDNYEMLEHGDVVLAAITSCTNTSNPYGMIGAGLLAKNAVEKGLKVKPFIKTSLTPGSKVVSKYLENSGLIRYLEELGFHTAGYGCATCIGNSGPLAKGVSEKIRKYDLTVAGVLSGNRNFEGRIHADIKANYLASPMLVIAYSLVGKIDINLEKISLGKDNDNNDVFLYDIWPDNKAIEEYVNKYVTSDIFTEKDSVMSKQWSDIQAGNDSVFEWDKNSTYVREPEFFMGIHKEKGKYIKDTSIKNARALAVLGDSITTDHISPAGVISAKSPAGLYLRENNLKPYQFNSYGSRRGNHEVMMRGTFANIRIRNKMVPELEGGYTKIKEDGESFSIYDAAMEYRKSNTDIIILAGKEYGTGSSRDWAAKGPFLQGVKAVVAQSYERIHRSNLIGMGILPLEFANGESVESLKLTGFENFTFLGLEKLEPGKTIIIEVSKDDKKIKEFKANLRLDNPVEIDYYLNNGILNKVLRDLITN